MPLGPPTPGPSPGSSPRPSPGRAGTLVAWAVILGATALLSFRAATVELPATVGEMAAGAVLEGHVRFLYGYREVVGDLIHGGEARQALSGEELFRQIRVIERGPVPHRQRFAVLAGDLVGPGEAERVLDDLERLLRERRRELRGVDGDVQEALRALYGTGEDRHDARAVEALSPERAELLREELGWFGELALAPEGSPRRAELLRPLAATVRRVLLAMAGGLAVLGLGFLGALLFWSLAAAGRVRFRLRSSGCPAGPCAEAFAVWILLFLGIGWSADATGLREENLAVQGAASLLSLAALAWLPIRGVPWGRVVEDLGLRPPARPLTEIGAGVACWAMNLPVLLVGFLVTAVLAAIQSRLGGEPDPLEPLVGPYHPVLGEIRDGTGYLAILLAASVIAPVLEEIAFRGLLHRHLREASRNLGRAASVAVSALVGGLVFASLHPQGWLLVPPLVAVSWALVHAREWRDSLLAPVAAHALHNAVVTWFAFQVLSGG